MQRTHATAAPQHPLSRRAFVGMAAGGLALALGGCSGAGTESGSGAVEGLASDTVQKSTPVTLKIYADEALQWQASPYEGHDTRLDYLAAAYHERVLASVSFEFEYVDFFELEQLTLEGFEDGDAVIAQSDVVTAGGLAGTLECGEQDYMVRELGFHLSDKCILVRAAGSEEQLPEADTLDGEDSADSSVNRMQKLPDYDGVIAIPDCTTAQEGIYANMVLAAQEFYSASTGRDGVYDESIAEKLRMYASQDEAIEAVENGRCQLAFAMEQGLDARYPEVEEAYSPPGGDTAWYSGAGIAGSGNAGVARDFFEFLENFFTG